MLQAAAGAAALDQELATLRELGDRDASSLAAKEGRWREAVAHLERRMRYVSSLFSVRRTTTGGVQEAEQPAAAGPEDSLLPSKEEPEEVVSSAYGTGRELLLQVG